MGHQRQRPKHLASKLLAIRQHLNLSQSEIAKALDIETNSARVCEWEHEDRVPDLIAVLRYARVAGVTMETLVDDDLKLPRRFNPRTR